jgi:hypothetical protein
LNVLDRIQHMLILTRTARPKHQLACWNLSIRCGCVKMS